MNVSTRGLVLRVERTIDESMAKLSPKYPAQKTVNEDDRIYWQVPVFEKFSLIVMLFSYEGHLMMNFSLGLAEMPETYQTEVLQRILADADNLLQPHRYALRGSVLCYSMVLAVAQVDWNYLKQLIEYFPLVGETAFESLRKDLPILRPLMEPADTVHNKYH